jgi:hypothetical protein
MGALDSIRTQGFHSSPWRLPDRSLEDLVGAALPPYHTESFQAGHSECRDSSEPIEVKKICLTDATTASMDGSTATQLT